MILSDDAEMNQKMIDTQMKKDGTMTSQTTTDEKKKAIKIELYEVTDENMLARLDSLE